MVAWVTALLGMLRLPMPGVFPGQGSRFKIGKPTRYMAGSVTFLPEQKVFIFATERGFYAISAVCTHLGCIVQKQNTPAGEFLCPCHGSKFDVDGRLLAGPAPSGLPWLAMSLSADGQLLVDGQKNVPPGTQFVV